MGSEAKKLYAAWTNSCGTNERQKKVNVQEIKNKNILKNGGYCEDKKIPEKTGFKQRNHF